jgi:hypothetical protein
MIVRRFVVRTDWPGLGFVVVGPGVGAVDASEFLAWLRRHGRGSYTQQTYALGLAHFLTWIDALGVELAGRRSTHRRVVHHGVSRGHR